MPLPNLQTKLTVFLPFLACFTAQKKRKIAVVQPEKQYVSVSVFSQNLGVLSSIEPSLERIGSATVCIRGWFTVGAVRGDRRYPGLYDAPVTCHTQALLRQGSLLWFVVSPSRSSSAHLEGILAPHMESDGASPSPPTLRMLVSRVTAGPVGRLSSEASSAGPARCPQSCFIAPHLSILLCEAPVSWGFLED